MNRFLVRSLVVTAAVAACFTSSGRADSDELQERGLGHAHRPVSRVDNAPPTAGGTAAVSPLVYHNGPLIQSPTVYVIWYGNWDSSNGSDTPAGQQIVRDFLNNIGGSPYFNLNTTYSAGPYPISGNVTFGGETKDTGSAGLNLNDSSILTIVNTAIKGGKLPYDANGVYFVLTSSADVRKNGFCTSYCGWHTAGNASNGHVRYSFVGNANKCINNCAAQSAKSPNGNPGVDGMISVIAHELEEATTDPDLNAWYDKSGAENADKCAWTFGTTSQDSTGAYYNMTLGGRNYLIQRNLTRINGSDYCRLQ